MLRDAAALQLDLLLAALEREYGPEGRVSFNGNGTR